MDSIKEAYYLGLILGCSLSMATNLLLIWIDKFIGNKKR